MASSRNRRYSLHSQLLAYVEQVTLFNQLNFSVSPFDPDTTGDPIVPTGEGPNETAAVTKVAVFLCPSDFDRMPARAWGQTNYRSCNGSSWSGRAGDGMFGQSTRIGLGARPATASRTRPRCASGSAATTTSNAWTSRADLFRNPSALDRGLLPRLVRRDVRRRGRRLHQGPSDANSGFNWLEGNMAWTRYNHLLPPERSPAPTA